MAHSKTKAAIAVAVIALVLAGVATLIERPWAARPKSLAIDLRTPQAAVQSLFDAINACDAKAASQCLLVTPGSERLVTAWTESMVAFVTLRIALVQRFGAEVLRDPRGNDLGVSDPTHARSLGLEPFGNTGEMLVGSDHDGWVRAVKVNGQWKLALVQVAYDGIDSTQMAATLRAYTIRLADWRQQVQNNTYRCRTLNQGREILATNTAGLILLSRATATRAPNPTTMPEISRIPPPNAAER